MQQGELQKISHLLHACLSLYTLYKHNPVWFNEQ